MERSDNRQGRQQAQGDETLHQTSDETVEGNESETFEAQARYIIHQSKLRRPDDSSLRNLGYQSPKLQKGYHKPRIGKRDRPIPDRDSDLANIIQDTGEVADRVWTETRSENRARRQTARKLYATWSRDRQAIVFEAKHVADAEAGEEQILS